MTFRNKRIRPPTPRSLVRLYSSVRASRNGRSVSVPTSDQVPDEMTASPGPVNGAATNALAVSCPATVHTVARAASPQAASWRASKWPMAVPGSTGSVANGACGRPSCEIRSRAHRPSSAPSSPLVDAIVASPASSPVIHRPNRSGTKARRGAARAAGLSASDIS